MTFFIGRFKHFGGGGSSSGEGGVILFDREQKRSDMRERRVFFQMLPTPHPLPAAFSFSTRTE